MPKSTSTLSKQTKNEILEAYSGLLSEFDELQQSAHHIAEPANMSLFEHTKEQSQDVLMASFSSLRLAVSQELSAAAERVIEELKTFNELRKAIEIAQERLRVTHHIEIAAETLAYLVGEHEEKKRVLEKEIALREFELNTQIEKKRKEWTREQEEHEYTLSISRNRNEDEYDYAAKKRTAELDAREKTIKERELHITQLEKEVAMMPQTLQINEARIKKEHEQKIDEIVATRIESIERERESERKLSTLERTHLENQLQKQREETNELRAALVNANAAAQTLATKVVEGISAVVHTNQKQDTSTQK